jgi:hypothetical protein
VPLTDYLSGVLPGLARRKLPEIADGSVDAATAAFEVEYKIHLRPLFPRVTSL